MSRTRTTTQPIDTSALRAPEKPTREYSVVDGTKTLVRGKTTTEYGYIRGARQ